MEFGLHIMLADPDPEQAAMLGRYLVDQGHNVRTCAKGSEIIPTLRKALDNKQPFELLIIGHNLRGMDGIECLERMQMLDRSPPSIFIEPFEGLDAATTGHLRSLGCRRSLSNPVDLGRLQQMIGELQGHRASDDIPFFGTTRMTRRSDTGLGERPLSGPIDRPHSAPMQRPQSAALERTDNPFDEADAAESRHASDAGLRLQPGTDDRLRRPSSAEGQARPRTGIYSTSYRRRGTGTVRRSVTGRIERETKSIHSGSMHVRCAHCGEQFSVPRRDEEFNVMCIHCSKLNRIPPAIPPKPETGEH